MKTYIEQIADLKATIAVKSSRMSDLMTKAADEARSLDSAESEEFDTLDDEIKTLCADTVRLERLGELSQKSAQPVSGMTQKSGIESRSVNKAPSIIINRRPEEHFKGQNYVRRVIAKALAQLDYTNPAYIAQKRWGHDSELVEVIKADVAGGGSGWGTELVSADNRYTGDFIEFLNEATVYDRLGLRDVPANVTIKGQDGAATGYWVGQGKAVPVSAPDFSSVSLSPLKVGALAVCSLELLRDSSPSAEMLIRDSLINAAAQRIDATFLSATAASSGVSPAGILNGLTAGIASGTTADNVRADIKALYSGFITAKNASGLTFVMNPALAKSLSLMRNSLGQVEFPGLSATGGVLEGDRVVTGDNVAADDFILLKPSDIWKIGEGSVDVSMSRDATIEMGTAPTGALTPVDMSENPVSMFQSDSVAFKIVRSMNFAKRRASAVAYIGDAAYTG